MFKARQKIGKYRIIRRVADGGFASVYQALDTVEGIRVALKVPRQQLVNSELLDDFRNEVRLTARLDHPNILPLKNADFINGNLIVAFPLGERSLAERLASRMTLQTALEFAEQMLEAAAYAHQRNIIHCDIKPENLILFPDNHLCLTDFGIAKVAQKTVMASGSGTVGYIAPEQAMGRPSFHSDVFSLGLILYRMLSGQLPEWPFEWPPPAFERLQRRSHPALIQVLKKSIELNPRERFRNADQLLTAFLRVKRRSLNFTPNGRRPHRNGTTRKDWRKVREQQFQRQFGRELETHCQCEHCKGPVSERMLACPWCGRQRKTHRGKTRFPSQCPRCLRGMKLDWSYCASCYGAGFEPSSTRQYSDLRYQARCAHPGCERKMLMPFMRYCPWCRRKVRRKWKVPGSNDKCASCGWGVLKTYWSHCPWCAKSLARA